MDQVLLYALYRYEAVYCSQNELVYIVIQLVEMRKLSHREVKCLSKATLIMSYRNQIQIQAIWLWSYFCVPVFIISCTEGRMSWC